MSSDQAIEGARISVQNIGGIDETVVDFSPGVNILSGKNATNRTSLLQAIMAVLGSDNVSIKGDANEASVELELGDDTYMRKLVRRGSTIDTDGDPYLDDSELADLFAFLVESNEARRAVSSNKDLREIIMRPINTDEIQRQIDRLVGERREIERELDELNSLKDRLPALEERRTTLREEIKDKRAELEATEAELEAQNANIKETREEEAELEKHLEELRSKRSKLEDVRYDLETERDSLESSRAEQRELEAEFEDLPETPAGEIEKLESQIDQLRKQKRIIESDVSELQSIIQFNEGMLEGTSTLLSSIGELDEPSEVTDELLPDETVTCWTCGNEVPDKQIKSTVGRLRELSQEKLGDIADIETQLEELNDEISDLRDQQRRREQVQTQLSRIGNEIERSEEMINRLTARREELQAEVEQLENEIEELEDESYEEVLDLHKEANQIEYELGRKEGNLEDIEAEIAKIEDSLDQEDQLEAQREELAAEIENLRTRIERIETEAIEQFNDHMDRILEILEYKNLTRIWLERVEHEAREGCQTVTKSVFKLHIIRQTESGTTYEDTVNHLSESEREVTGLVFALAGYLAHDVYETVPFMLLDSLEAIDAKRIATLIRYLEDYSKYLVVALLPEDAAPIKDEYRQITDI